MKVDAIPSLTTDPFSWHEHDCPIMNWDYVAGFFDGEGAAVIRPESKGQRKNCTLVFTNTNKAVLEEIRGFLKAGNIYSRDGRRYGWKDCHELIISDHESCLRPAKEIVPRCMVKHSRLSELIGFVEQSRWARSRVSVRWHREISPDMIYQLYVVRGLSLKRIAVMFGCTRTVIKNRLTKIHVPTRDGWLTQRLRLDRELTAERLQELYNRQALNIDQIAKRFNCSYGAVWRRMHELKIPRRPSRFESASLHKSRMAIS